MLAKGKTTTFPSRVQAGPLCNEEQHQTESPGVLKKKQRKELLWKLVIKVSKHLSVSCCI